MDKQKKDEPTNNTVNWGRGAITLTPFSVAIIIIVLLALFTRLVALEMRPIHHDESMFAYYSHLWSLSGDYRYQPILHGPLMLYVTGSFFWLFGDSDISMRLAVVFLGVGLILLVLGLRRWLTDWGAISAMVLLLFSPGIMHYSRFFRHDIPLAFFSLLLVIVLTRLREKRKRGWGLFYLVLVSTLLICIKENSLILLFTFVSFSVLMLLIDVLMNQKVLKKPKSPKLLSSLTEQSTLLIGLLCSVVVVLMLWLGYFFTGEGTLEIFSTKNFIRFKSPFWQYFGVIFLIGILTPLFCWIRVNIQRDRDKRLVVTQLWEVLARHWLFLILGFCLSLVVYIVVFTDFFKYPKDIFQIYRETFAYWWGQHKIHRIKGEFHYYFVLIFLYELPALLIVIIGGIKELWRRVWIRYGLIPGFLVLSILIALSFSTIPLNREYWDKTFHLTSKWHIFMIFVVLIFGGVLTIIYLIQRYRVRAFLLWWTFISLLMYSYAGEKVPWVSVHISLPLILLAGSYLGDLLKSPSFQRRPVLWITVLGILVFWQVRNCILLCFYNYDSARERMNYAQTVRDVKKVADEIERLSFFLDKENTKIFVQGTGEAVWPLRWWYLRNYKNCITAGNIETIDAPIVVVDWDVAQRSRNLKENYRCNTKYYVRTWWQPRSNTIKALLGIWRWLIPKHHRTGETEKLLRASVDEWKKVGMWILFRKPFDHYGSQWPTFTTVDFAFCIRKDILF